MVSWSKPRSSSSALSVFRRGARIATVLAAAMAMTAMLVVTPVGAEAPPLVEEYAIIVSPDVTVKSMSLERVRRLFLFRERYWKPGLQVKLIFSEDGVEPQSFLLERIYRMDYSSLRRLIVEKLYQEEIDLAPKVVASDEVAVAFVASGRGLIALVRASAARGSHAQIVPIDGNVPGAPGYALRR
jgi:hypothetical protein